MPIVEHTYTGVGGPVEGVGVRIRPVLYPGVDVSAYDPATNTTVEGTTGLSTDIAGHWAANLYATAPLEPAGVCYEVRQIDPTDGRETLVFVTVPVGGGPYELEELPTVGPGDPPPFRGTMASEITVMPFATITATDVQAALQELFAEAGGGGGGVTDHGALTGLNPDDDHPQYQTAARVNIQIAAHAGAADPHPVYLTAAEGNAVYDATGAAAAAVAGHAASGDPHPVYLTAAEGNAVYDATGAAAAAAAASIPLAQKSAASGVASLDVGSRVAQSPKLHAGDHQPGGLDAMAVDAAAGVGSLRTLSTTATTAAPGNHTHPAVRKTANQSVSSSVALVDCTDLALALAAFEAVAFEAVIFFDGLTTGDLKVNFSVPAGAVVTYGVHGNDTAATTVTASSFNGSASAVLANINLGCVAANTLQMALLKGFVTNGANAGNLQLQFAQRVSDATATRILADSHIRKLA